MPLIHNFTSTSYTKAFILNALATTISIFVALIIKSHFDTFTDKQGNVITFNNPTWKSTIITLCATFFAALASYYLLYIIFGYGKGMFAN